MKISFGIFLGILVTVAYYQSRPATVSARAKKEFQVFSQNEAKKFAEAKDPSEKLRAAEELYGKMMVLFLANLGLELQKNTPVSHVAPEIAEKSQVTAPAVPDVVMKTECAPCAQTVAAEKKKEEKRLTTPEKFSASKYPSKLDPVIRKMRGVFVGKLTYFAGSRRGKIDGALIEVDLIEKEGSLDGAINVILTDEDNKPYSRNRGRGGNKTIRYNEKDRMVYVEASPNSFFAFRAREFDRSEVSGEYYEDNAMVGKTLLFRQ